ncbi:MAG: trypsin-like peptidase domain-containing protein [Gemmatimonadetes bacterium]|nr:trypsin-like peptidase domain-containing protein [Gemmatimonadota bacterium]
MPPKRPLLLCSLLVMCGMVDEAMAQGVTELQVLPENLTLVVGENGTAIATAFDDRGNPLGVVPNLTWISNDLEIATVSWDAASPTFATIQALAPGITQIEARSGTVRTSIVVVVRAAAVQPIEPVIVPDSVLPVDVAAASIDLIARIEPHNFGFAQPCRVGGFVGDDLLVTSYVSVRGADSIEVVLATGERLSAGVGIAAYDPATDLAVLRIPAARTGALTIGANPTRGDFVWVVGQPDCQQATTARTSVAASGPRLTMDRPLVLGQLGAPVINQEGEIVGLAAGGTQAVTATDIGSLVNQARQNVAAGSVLSPAQVAAAERHTFGSVALRSNLSDGIARIAPLEDWHWPELARQSTLPFTLSGPQGRYEVELLSAGAVQSTTTVSLEAGVAAQLLLTPTPVVVEPPPEPPLPETPPGAEIEPQAGGGGGFPIALVILGLAGGGAAAFLLASKGSADGNGNGTRRGSIRIVVGFQ